MQDRANVSADFLELMKQEIIEVIKKYIEVDETSIDVRMTNKQNDDGTNGAPALYANIPILNIKDDIVREKNKEQEIKKEENNNEGEKLENNEETKEENEPINVKKHRMGNTYLLLNIIMHRNCCSIFCNARR